MASKEHDERQGVTKATRLIPIDALRGVIMIVMALDHANLFIARAHSSPEFWMLPPPHYDSALAFLTRFVTHLAAPGFFFLMGVGMVLFAETRRQRDWTEWRIAWHFAVRGILLIGLQLLVENPAWQLGSLEPAPTYFGVLYGLGMAMLIGILMIRLNNLLLLVFSIAVILASELLLPNPLDALRNPPPLWVSLLLIPHLASHVRDIQVFYPPFPWLGLLGFGLVYGRWLIHDRPKAYRWAPLIGTGMLALFVLVRSLGGIGNIHPAEQAGWIEFLTLVKYPPSLVFVLFTLGSDLLLLGLFAHFTSWMERWGWSIVVLGRSPLFFYIAHLYLYGLLGLAFASRVTGIPGMYPFWLLGLVALFFLCWAYGRFKHAQSPDSLWRFG